MSAVEQDADYRHDLRQPMTVIRGYFSMLQSGDVEINSASWRHYCAQISDALNRMDRMLEDQGG